MRKADLTVIKIVNKNYFDPAITSEDFPGEMDCLLRSGMNALDDNESRSVLLITDNANLIRSFLNRRLENSYAVYIGDTYDIGAAFEEVTDVWSPFDGGRVLKKRYLLLLDHIRCRTELKELTSSVQYY